MLYITLVKESSTLGKAEIQQSKYYTLLRRRTEITSTLFTLWKFDL